MLLALGESSELIGEARSRTELTLPEAQQRLAEAFYVISFAGDLSASHLVCRSGVPFWCAVLVCRSGVPFWCAVLVCLAVSQKRFGVSTGRGVCWQAAGGAPEERPRPGAPRLRERGRGHFGDVVPWSE